MILIDEHLHCELGKAEFCHGGDFGDIIYSLCAIRTWLEHHDDSLFATLHIYNDPGHRIHGMLPERTACLMPLLECQTPWLKVVYHAERRKVYGAPGADLNMVGFMIPHTRAIVGRALAALNLRDWSWAQKAWISVPPSRELVPDGVEFAFFRTHRYRSHDFPWTKIIDWFGSKACFLGHPAEYASFCEDFGVHDLIPHVVTSSMLEAAQVINASRIVFGNQSGLFAVADALKKPRVLELYCAEPDVDYGSRSCLPLLPGMEPGLELERILELETAPHTI